MLSLCAIGKMMIKSRHKPLVAQSIDMRTQKQFLEMINQTGLQ